ncbi:NAD(P)-binding domain superfamily protein [Pleurotus pulmonarius]
MQTIKEAIVGKTSTGTEEAHSADLKDMTALVTGGTGGIGFEVAKALATSGARVLVMSRKSEHGEKAVAQIQAAGDTPVDVKFIACDLGNLTEVRDVAEQIKKDEGRLDILVAAAGVGVNKFDETKDGIDRHLGVNHLGHFLLVNRLLPLMIKTSKFPTLNQARVPRIVTISSELHRTAPGSIKFSNKSEVASTGASKETNESKDLSANSLYARTKVANILFTRRLVDSVLTPNNIDIMALATHPGAVHTGQQDQFKEAYGEVLGSVLKSVTVPFMKDPNQGSASTVWAAVSREVDGSDGGGGKAKWQGSYVTNPGTKSEPTAQASNDQLAKNLWRLSEELIQEKLGSDGLLKWGV